MNAKKITPAPRSTPLHPNSPNLPVFGGMNGCQFAVLMYDDAEPDEQQQHDDLHDDDRRIEAGRFSNADDENGRNEEDDRPPRAR